MKTIAIAYFRIIISVIFIVPYVSCKRNENVVHEFNATRYPPIISSNNSKPFLTYVRFSHDGTKLLYCEFNKINVVDTESLKEINSFPLYMNGVDICCFELHPTKPHVVSLCFSNAGKNPEIIRCIDYDSGKEVFVVNKIELPYNTLDLLPRYLPENSGYHKLKSELASISDEKLEKNPMEFSLPLSMLEKNILKARVYNKNHNAVEQKKVALFSPQNIIGYHRNDKWLLIAGKLMVDRLGIPMAIVYDCETGKVVRNYNSDTGSLFWYASMNPCGNEIAVSTNEETIIWDMESGDKLKILPRSEGVVQYSADGQYLFANNGMGLKAWKIISGEKVFQGENITTWEYSTLGLANIHLDREKSIVIASSIEFGGVVAFDFPSGKVLSWIPKGMSTFSIDYLPEKSLLAVAADSGVRLFNLDRSKTPLFQEHHLERIKN